MIVVLGYALLALPAWALNTGMCFHYFQGECVTLRPFREDGLFALLYGGATSLVWPVTVPLTWWLTDYAYHGVWRQRDC